MTKEQINLIAGLPADVKFDFLFDWDHTTIVRVWRKNGSCEHHHESGAVRIFASDGSVIAFSLPMRFNGEVTD